MAEQFQNFFVTKLREACDAVATTIYVETVPSITEGTLVLEYANSTKHEIIHFTGVSGYGLTGCTRGLEGTTAQSHSAGTDVRQNLTAGMIDKIINGVITTENIANSAVTTAKINNGAVTADKIDFTTLNENYLLWQVSKPLDVGSGIHTLCEFTVQKAGRYAVQGVIGGTTSSVNNYCMISVKKNGVLQHEAVASCVERGGVIRCDVPFYTTIQCSVGDKIKVEYSSPGTGIRAGTAIVAELLY